MTIQWPRAACQAFMASSIILTSWFLVGGMAQTDGTSVTATISGTVVDARTSLPIGGAVVICLRRDEGPFPPPDASDWALEPLPTGGQDPHAARRAVITAPDGSFQFILQRPSQFAVLAKAEGYVALATPELGKVPSSGIEERKPAPPLIIRLLPQLSISGQVVDVNTRRPVAGLKISAYCRKQFGQTNPLLPCGATALTDSKGRYWLAGLPPNKYFLEARPPTRPLVKSTSQSAFVDDVRTGYPVSWFPGVRDIDQASPLDLQAQASVEASDFKVEQARMPAIRGRIDATTGLSEGQKVRVSLTQVSRSLIGTMNRTIAEEDWPVGEPFEIDQLTPGEYYLFAYRASKSVRVMAVRSFSLEDANLDGLDLVLSSGLSVNGKLLFAGGSSNPPEAGPIVSKARIQSQPILRLRYQGESTIQTLQSDGTFRWDGVTPDTYHLEVVGLPAEYLLTEVRYNGVVCPNSIVVIDPSAVSQSLLLTIDRIAASVTVSVSDGHRPVEKATVLLAAEPVDKVALRYRLSFSSTDAQGNVRFSQLAPGSYRALAYPSGASWREDPHLETRLQFAQQLKLGPNSQASLQLRLD